MRLSVKVKAGAKKESVRKINETHFEISVKEPAKEGRANWAVIRALAEQLEISSSSINIIKGHTSRNKVIEIN